jgi:2'-5' RNA ligase
VGEWRAKYDLAAQKGVPAHITVLYPFVPPAEITPGVVHELVGLIGRIAPFDFVLARTARFPNVVYLAPEPAQPFSRLTKAVCERWPGFPPYGGEFDEVVPHLTVVERGDGDDIGILDAVERDIVRGVPIQARAGEVWLMQGNGRWSVRARFPLGVRG